MDHNVIWNCEAGVRVNGPAEGHRIYNNTLFHCQDVGTRTYHVWPPKAPNIRIEWPKKIYSYDKGNNLFLGKAPDQELADVEKSRFWPNLGSRAIDAGKPIKEITDGFMGDAPDLGAYEAGGPRWVPGRHGQVAEQSPAGDSLKAAPEE